MLKLEDERQLLSVAHDLVGVMDNLNMLLRCHRVPGQVDTLWLYHKVCGVGNDVIIKFRSINDSKTACFTEDGQELNNIAEFVRNLYVPPPP